MGEASLGNRDITQDGYRIDVRRSV